MTERLARSDWEGQGVRQAGLERRLAATVGEVRRLREELRISDEQLAHHRATAGEAETRALVEGSPLARRDHEVAVGDLRRAERARDAVAGRLAALVVEQDALLERLHRLRDDGPHRAGRASP